MKNIMTTINLENMINIEELINQGYLEISFNKRKYYCTFAINQDNFAVINLKNQFEFDKIEITLDEWNYELIENTILEMIEAMLTY